MTAVARAAAVGVLVAAGLFVGGCEHDSPPAQALVPLTPGDNYVPHVVAPKPLPDSAFVGAAPAGAPFEDPLIVQQRLPEEGRFLEAYRHVRQPRVVIYVNRTLDGRTVPVNPGGPAESVVHEERSTGGVNISRSQSDDHADYFGHDSRSNSGGFQSSGPAAYTESTATYLQPGQYDDAAASTLDYQVLENLLADDLSCGGSVRIISPDYVAAHLSRQDQQALADGRPEAVSGLVQALGADVLIQVQAHPTKQGPQLQVLTVAEAMNTRGGESIGHATVAIPLPIDKGQLNDYARFLAAKLMIGMTGAWEAYPEEEGQSTQPQPMPQAMPMTPPPESNQPPISQQPPMIQQPVAPQQPQVMQQPAPMQRSPGEPSRLLPPVPDAAPTQPAPVPAAPVPPQMVPTPPPAMSPNVPAPSPTPAAPSMLTPNPLPTPASPVVSVPPELSPPPRTAPMALPTTAPSSQSQSDADFYR